MVDAVVKAFVVISFAGPHQIGGDRANCLFVAAFRLGLKMCLFYGFMCLLHGCIGIFCRGMISFLGTMGHHGIMLSVGDDQDDGEQKDSRDERGILLRVSITVIPLHL